MLESAHQAQTSGVDVVVGYVERHTRPDTLALLGGLEQIPTRSMTYRGTDLHEFDLDAALQRRPQIILVDELAHSNAPQSRHLKRYQDVEELLRAGIDVFTTVNVQHLESLNDLVAQITHIQVSERVPDFIFDSAAQIELVDIEPDDLITRLQTGKVYRQQQAAAALDNFFTRDNLSALREIAMRRTADRLSLQAQKTDNETAMKASEHILTCLSSSPTNPTVIRTAARMSEAFHSGFTALYVETAESKVLKGEDLKRLQSNIRLAEQLGARIATVYGEDLASQIAEYAKISGITKIVLGHTNHTTSPFSGKTLIDKLTHLLENVDIYIIPEVHMRYRKRSRFVKQPKMTFSWPDTAKSVGILVLATAISFAMYDAGLREASIITTYLLGVLLTGVWTNGYLYGIIVSLLSVVAFNFFFTVPRFSLSAIDPNYPITFIVMLIASLIATSLATRVKRQARQSAQKAYSMELLMNGNQLMQQGKDESDILKIAATQLSNLLDRPILYALLGRDDKMSFQVVPASEAQSLYRTINQEELAVADWVAKNGKHAGATTTTLTNAKNMYLAVRGNQGSMAIVGIPFQFYPHLDAFEKNLMIAMLEGCGLILERRRLRDEKQAAELEKQREQLRSNLLRAISHDLFTPLTSISGNAGVLLDTRITVDEETKREIYNSIYDDSMWLINLTENLLSTTKIENGSMQLNMSVELIDDVFREALSHVDRRSAEHHISVKLADDMLLANIDARLVIQVIINIVNNAIKYTPRGSHITLSARRDGARVRVTIADDGPGIPESAKQHLFDMFYIVSEDSPAADSRRGLGLGLSLCKSIVEAHEGTITVGDNTPHGAVFSFTLPLEEVSVQHE